MEEGNMANSDETAGTLVELDSVRGSLPHSASTTTAKSRVPMQAAASTACSSAMQGIPPSSSGSSVHLSSNVITAPPTTPRFLQQLFAHEEQRRAAAGPRTQQGDVTGESESTDVESMTTPGATNSVLPAGLCINSPASNGSIAPSPGLGYSASSAASSETSNFLVDMAETDARSATSTAPSCQSTVVARQPKRSGPASHNTPSFIYHARPPGSQYDYASSASSTAGDDACAVDSEAGSIASRSTSPSTKSTGILPHSVQNYTYASPSTSPFFNHQNGGLHHVPSHAQHHHGTAVHQPNLNLQPLKLPPPSLDLPDSSQSPSSSTTPLCDRAFNGFIHPISPPGWGKGTASTSQTTTPGVMSPESSVVAGSNQRHRSQHYSPLHPFHQQGFLSPQRSRSLHTPLTILGPDLHDAAVQDGSTLRPPDNFAMVCPGVYRSSFPSSKHFEFLRTIGLKTVLTLVQEEEYPAANRDFFKQEKIRFLQIGIPGNKEPFVTIPDEKIRRALSVVLDKRNHPLLIHCNKGKHRTGCLVGCLRKMQCWSSTSIFEEYRRFSFPKSRAMDQLFIELFQPDWTCVETMHLPAWCQGEDAGLSGRKSLTASTAVVPNLVAKDTASTSPVAIESSATDASPEVR